MDHWSCALCNYFSVLPSYIRVTSVKIAWTFLDVHSLFLQKLLFFSVWVLNPSWFRFHFGSLLWSMKTSVGCSYASTLELTTRLPWPQSGFRSRLCLVCPGFDQFYRIKCVICAIPFWWSCGFANLGVSRSSAWPAPNRSSVFEKHHTVKSNKPKIPNPASPHTRLMRIGLPHY